MIIEGIYLVICRTIDCKGSSLSPGQPTSWGWKGHRALLKELGLLLKSALPQQLAFPISLHPVCNAHVLPVSCMGLAVGTELNL